MFRGRVKTIHFVGIGGIGMSGIAEVLISHGFRVTGSDAKEGDTIRHLRKQGATVHMGHKADQVSDADVVIYSSAITGENPELVEARRLSVPVIARAEMLGELMRLHDGIAIAGSHGKTTTTSLVATILQHAKLDPTVVIGGRLNAMGSGATRGTGEWLVAEADESDGSFLHLHPTIAIITNIDPEHLDHYGSYEAVKDTFAEFARHVPFYGLVVACLDHPAVQSILPDIDKRTVTYGMSAQADYRALQVRAEGLSTRFMVMRGDDALGEFQVNMPGSHNVLNALAAIAVGDEIGVTLDAMKEALKGFKGVHRRFTVLGETKGITVVDDYGHHPAEIEATLGAAEVAFGRRVIVAFQPHRYTRTETLFDQFTRAFNRADIVLMADIYGAGEQPIEGVTSQHLVEAIREHGHRDVNYVGGVGSVADAVLARVQPGDIVITLGAGDISKVSREIYNRLSS